MNDTEELIGGLRDEELMRLSRLLRRRKISLIDGLVELGILTGYVTAEDLEVIRDKLDVWHDCSQNRETQKWGYGDR